MRFSFEKFPSAPKITLAAVFFLLVAVAYFMKTVGLSTNPSPTSTQTVSAEIEETTTVPEVQQVTPTASFEPTAAATPTTLVIPTESLTIVDSEHPLTEEYINSVVVPKLVVLREVYPQIAVINENIQVLDVCVGDLIDLIQAAESDGVEITVRSAFRSYYQQQVAYDQATDKTSVNKPGQSQHHTGLAIDFTSPEVGNVVGIYTGFGQSEAGIWLAEHAYEYGFVLAYTNQHDGLMNEDWHYFYVGKDLAKMWHERRENGEEIDLFMLQEEFQPTSSY